MPTPNQEDERARPAPQRVEDGSPSPPDAPRDEAGDIDDVVGPLLKYSLQLASTTTPSAPIRMPDQDALTVRLVPIHQLQRFDELRDDAALWQAIAWTAGGGVLGFLTNFLTAQALPTEFSSYAVIGLLCVVSAGAARKGRVVGRRIEQLRSKLFEL